MKCERNIYRKKDYLNIFKGWKWEDTYIYILYDYILYIYTLYIYKYLK